MGRATGTVGMYSKTSSSKYHCESIVERGTAEAVRRDSAKSKKIRTNNAYYIPLSVSLSLPLSSTLSHLD